MKVTKFVNYVLIICFVVMCKINSFSQETYFVKQFGTFSMDYARSIGTDSSGNVYVCGETYGTFSGQISSGSIDAFLMKYDSNGNEVWVKQFGTVSFDELTDIAIDNMDNIYVCGNTGGILPVQISSGSTDVFLIKYDNNGNEIWARQFGTAYVDNVTAISLDSLGNIYVYGLTSGTFPLQKSSGTYDIFMRKYDSDGNEVWTKQSGHFYSDYSEDITIDNSNNIYICGRYFLDLVSIYTDTVGFLKKCDSNGNEIWVKEFDDSKQDTIKSISLDNSANIYICGDSLSIEETYTVSGHTFIKKYDSNGNEIWSKQFNKYSLPEWTPHNLVSDSLGNIYVCGEMSFMHPDFPEFSAFHVYLSKYDNGGNEIWARHFGSSSIDRAESVIISNSGDVFLCGYTFGELPLQISSGTVDAYVIKNIQDYPSPFLTLDKHELNFGEVKIEEDKTLSFTITNSGQGVLSGVVSTNEYWIKVNPTSFVGNTVTVDVTVNRMTVGSYSGTVNVVSNGGFASVAVDMTATCVLVRPNPYNPRSGNLTFFGDGIVPKDTKIKIYTLSGELIKTLSNVDEESSGNLSGFQNEIVWDGKNEDGKEVVRGIYIYTYESPREKGVGKFTLIRDR